ncbi:class I glutamine amidotransferase-like protein [Rickenella mellea]|uniref:Class I glutamine amidotransferase-like protein n=1 Tax=Rickenella mellea TaxID=50990 RepID=A0A4Y7QF04_9AGAM|nr:class I glutamine amidotransferase-like protein [Rickenella mellea]
MTQHLSLAVCLFPSVTALDYQGPIEVLGFLTPENLEKRKLKTPACTLTVTYLSHTLDPVVPTSGPATLPQLTYDDALKQKIQYDILLVPGGLGARPGAVPDALVNFLKVQAPGAKYVFTVCTGSWILAGTGYLDGRRATTNKAAFKSCKESTSNKITWVPKARWVADGNIWTSSGVVAGLDMANAFLIHLVGEDMARIVRERVELRASSQDDDEFAEVHGLI